MAQFEITVESDGEEYTGEFELTRSGDIELVRITPPSYPEDVEQRLNDAAHDKRYDWIEEVQIEHAHNRRD